MDQPPHSTKNEASQVSDCGCGIPSPLNYDVIIIIKTLTDYGDHLHLFEIGDHHRNVLQKKLACIVQIPHISYYFHLQFNI